MAGLVLGLDTRGTGGCGFLLMAPFLFFGLCGLPDGIVPGRIGNIPGFR